MNDEQKRKLDAMNKDISEARSALLGARCVLQAASKAVDTLASEHDLAEKRKLWFLEEIAVGGSNDGK